MGRQRHDCEHFVFDDRGQGRMFACPPPCPTPDRAALERAHFAAVRLRNRRRRKLARRVLTTAFQCSAVLLMAICSEASSMRRALELVQAGRLKAEDWLLPGPVAIARAALALGERGEVVTALSLRHELRRGGVLLLEVERDPALLQSLTAAQGDPQVCGNVVRFERWVQELTAPRAFADLIPALLAELAEPEAPEEKEEKAERAGELSLLATPIHLLERPARAGPARAGQILDFAAQARAALDAARLSN